MPSLTKNVPYSVFVTDLEQTPDLLKSDLNSNNFPVLLDFWITYKNTFRRQYLNFFY